MKKIISFILALSLPMQVLTLVKAEENVNSVEIHVSPNGLDSNPATADKPIKTIEEAQKRARAINTAKIDVDVIFHEGEYRILKSVEITSDDSGTKEHPVEYKAAKGEKVVFKGSVELDETKFKGIEKGNIYDRLKEKAKGKVAVLDLKAQGINNLATLCAVDYGNYSNGYNNLYIDGISQTLARWPNNRYANITKTIDASKGVFRVDDATASRWGEAEDPRIAGLLCWDWAYERTEVTGVDPVTRYVTINVSRTISKKITNANARYFIYNLLEEIDEPGEWYIDKDNLLLYYYPPYPVKDTQLEISVLQSPVINMTSAEYINISGIEFCQTTTDAIQMTKCNNITVSGCNFHDIGRSAINAGNNTYADNVRNVIIENNTFTNIALRAVFVSGGVEETLEESGNIIRNNYFAHLALDKRSYEGAIQTSGVGILIENNTICDSPHVAISLNGSLHKIRYNEIYDVCKDSNDMGAIYTGRNAYKRGHEISYNYIHDIVPREGLAGLLCGIYFDDSQSSGDIHHNIFENIPRSVFYNGGNDAYVHDNIVIDSVYGVHFAYNANEIPNQNLFIDAINFAEANPIYYERFPEMKTIDINYTKSHNNRVIGNLMVNSFGNSMTALDDPEWSEDPDNTNYLRQNLSYNNVSYASVEEFGDFNNPEEGDFTIKTDSEILSEYPELGKIKLSEIGVQYNMDDYVNNERFIKIYPKNGEKKVSASGIYLKWQPANIRTVYHVKLATDKELKNVIYEETTKDNYIHPSGVESGGKTYYWNVTAEDGFGTIKSEDKSAYGAVYSFVTSTTDKLEQFVLGETIKKADKLISKISEGQGPGQCKKETLDEFKSVLSEAKKINAKKYGFQTEVDEINKKLEGKIASLPADINKGYQGLDEWLTSIDCWQGENAVVNNGVLSVPADSFAMSDEFVTTYQVYKFKVKTTAFNSGFFTIAFKIGGFGTPWNPGMVNYSFYFKEKLIEFQRYSNGGGIIDTCENNGIIKAGEWADIEIGALDVEGGIQVYLKANGEELFNYFDDTGLVSSDGYLQFGVHGAAEDVHVMSAGELPEFDSSIVMGGKIDYNNIVYNSYSSADFTENELNSELKSNEIAEMNVKLEFDGAEKIILGTSDEGYIFDITKDTVKLTRNSAKGNQILYIGKNDLLVNDENIKLSIGALKVEDGTRIVLYANDKRVVDCVDVYKGIVGGKIKFHDNEKGVIIK